jgi:YfiH family protein
MSADKSELPLLWRSDLLAALPGVLHGVTRRVPGMGVADGNVGFSAPRNRADAWAMRKRWCAAAGLDADNLVTLGQVHGADVHMLSATDAGRGAMPGSLQIGLGDALMTNEAGPVLMTLHADCQPIFFIDPGTPRRGAAVAVAHAGWRGTVADIAGSTVAAMTLAYGTSPEDLRVALGPAIGACCYAVGGDVAHAWRDRVGTEASAALAADGEGFRFSMTVANTLLLARAGVRLENIEATAICTRCDGEHWFSHRGQGAQTGRFGAMIAIQGDGMMW